jgi:sulfur carrier protein
MNLTVNGESRTLADGATVTDLVEAVAKSPKGIAVAVDGVVVPRATWAAVPLRDGQTVELLVAVQGG